MAINYVFAFLVEKLDFLIFPNIWIFGLSEIVEGAILKFSIVRQKLNFPKSGLFYIKNMFFISNLVRIGSGRLRNMFISYFCLSEAPAGFFFSEK